MSKKLIVNNTTFNYPAPGDDPGWGEDATGWAEEVTSVLDTLGASGPGGGSGLDITVAVIGNDISAPIDIVGVIYDKNTVLSATIKYTLTRKSDTFNGSISTYVGDGINSTIVSVAHGLNTDDVVTISGTSELELDGNDFFVSVIDPNTFLIGSTFNGSGSSGTFASDKDDSETGTLELIYNTLDDDWFISRSFSNDDAGVDFSVTTLGQVQYTSTKRFATGYAGEMKYTSETFPA